MALIKLTSEVRTPLGEGLREELLDWLPDIPAWAVLTAIIVEKGSQRDPEALLVGLRATWEQDTAMRPKGRS